MYTQYQQYQQPAAAASSQQQAMTWNGSAWVNTTSSNVQSSTYSTYEQPRQPATTTTLPPNPVSAYTQYYHGWQAHGKECEEYLRKIPISNTNERAEAQRRLDWAKYYADQSSRAAHHFHQNPAAVSAPFELPPAPPENNNKPIAPPALSLQTPTAVTSTNSSSSDEHTPGSLTRYVKRCLEQCSTADQKKSVQADVEKKIAEAIQAGNLHSKNWDLEAMIPVPGGAATISRTPSMAARQPNPIASTSSNYYGPAAAADSHTSHQWGKQNNNNRSKYTNRYDSNLPENDSYYGHSSSAASPPSMGQSSYGTTKTSSFQTETSYYGPSSSSFHANSSGDYSLSRSSQKHASGTNDDFIPFGQRKNKKAKKDSSATSSKGFEKSSHVLAKRASRFAGPGGISAASKAINAVNGHDRYMGKGLIGGSQKKLDEQDFEKMTVKGTCQTLEKEYLRLTAPPRAELVRPQPILERHLANLKQEYADKKHEYLWFCSQFKAVRQDCTVQRIQNAFAVNVYETHARIALQEGDLNEYNQCQTQLKELYESREAIENHEEFIAYRLLYYVFLSTNEKYDGGSSDMFKIMLSLSSQQRSHPAIAHALRVRETVAFGDYLQFFRLHKQSPNLGRHLTSLLVPTIRLRALRVMAKAFRPSLALEVCTHQLGFDALEEGREWLASCGCVIEGSNVMMKDSTIRVPEVEKKNSLI